MPWFPATPNTRRVTTRLWRRIRLTVRFVLSLVGVWPRVLGLRVALAVALVTLRLVGRVAIRVLAFGTLRHDHLAVDDHVFGNGERKVLPGVYLAGVELLVDGEVDRSA